MIEIEIQNETRQTQERLRFAAVPRIGEGIRLREPDGIWASYDVLDLWYQKAEYGDVWEPYLHIRLTPGEGGFDRVAEDDPGDSASMIAPMRHDLTGMTAMGRNSEREAAPFTI